VKRGARRTVVQVLVAAALGLVVWMFYRQSALAAGSEGAQGGDGPGSDVDRPDRQGDRETTALGDLWRSVKRALGLQRRER
jgi:hypothetical protein